MIRWWKCNCNWWSKLKALWRHDVLVIFGCHRFVSSIWRPFALFPSIRNCAAITFYFFAIALTRHHQKRRERIYVVYADIGFVAEISGRLAKWLYFVQFRFFRNSFSFAARLLFATQLNTVEPMAHTVCLQMTLVCKMCVCICIVFNIEAKMLKDSGSYIKKQTHI